MAFVVLTALRFREGLLETKPFCLSEPGQRDLLRFETQPRAALFRRRYPDVRYCRFHHPSPLVTGPNRAAHETPQRTTRSCLTLSTRMGPRKGSCIPIPGTTIGQYFYCTRLTSAL